MLLEEAKWLGRELQSIALNLQNAKLLNVGSGTAVKTDDVQSHQSEYILRPLKEKLVETINTDIEAGEGVDLVGDLTDKAFLDSLEKKKFNIVTCNNLLEHIETIKPICDSFQTIVAPNGFLIVSVPYRYPYHPDPIDTMFRPAVKDLERLIYGFELVKGEIVSGTRNVKYPNGEVKQERNYFQTLMNDKAYAFRLLIRSLLPFYKFSNWWNTVRYLPYMFSPYKVTCVILKKI